MSQKQLIHRHNASLLMMNDALLVMLKQESAYSCHDYLHNNNSEDYSVCTHSTDDDDDVSAHNLPHAITPEDRAKLVDWCYGVVDRCELERETVAVAMAIVDRFMSVSPDAAAFLDDRHRYQLLVVTALYVSVKVAEREPFSTGTFSANSRGMYSVEEIEGMEMSILSALEWRLCAPTPMTVAGHILELLRRLLAVPSRRARAGTKADAGDGSRAVGNFAFDLLRDEVARQTDAAVRDYYFAARRPSTVAIASILNAVGLVPDDRDRESLRRGLLCVLTEFMPRSSIDGPESLVEASWRLAALVEENDEGDGGHSG